MMAHHRLALGVIVGTGRVRCLAGAHGAFRPAGARLGMDTDEVRDRRLEVIGEAAIGGDTIGVKGLPAAFGRRFDTIE